MTRALLILPTATYRATAFLEAAQRLGVEVVTASERPQALASVMGDAFVEVPLGDPKATAARIVAHAERLHLDAVIGVDDSGVLAAALAAEQLGLPHDPPDAVAATRDKAVMRGRLAAAGVPQPRFVALDEATPQAAVEAASALGFPVVVKARTLSASRGVIRADEPAATAAAAGRVLALLESCGETAGLLVEEYLPGDEVALEALSSGDGLVALALFDKPDPLVGPYFEETIYVTPSRLEPALQKRLVATADRAARALGLAHGPVHAELRIGPGTGEQRRVDVLELAGRSIGGRCAAALRFSTGASLEQLVLAHALGRPMDADLVPGASGVMMLPIRSSGRLVAVDGVERAAKVPGITGIEITVPPGSRIVALPEGDRYLGFLFARGEDPATVEAALRAAHGELEVRIAIEATP